jgi:S-adenosylmethionine hydrolase
MIVLLSDFGESEYVGVMKGVIYSLSPDTQVADLTHSVSPQSIIEGAWILKESFRYFPPGTIFVCVVDPGVGTERDAVLVETDHYKFIGPDNGLMYAAATLDRIRRVSSLVVHQSASHTFHGRDVFARAAGYIARGDAQKVLGGFKAGLSVTLQFPQHGRAGIVVRVDRFGNIITNIPPAGKESYTLVTDDLRWDISWSDTYAEGPARGVFLVTGSYGTLEVCVRDGRATDELLLKAGDQITLE